MNRSKRIPPIEYRFKPGQSGNPSGRPKRRLPPVNGALVSELMKTVVVVEGGRKMRITKYEVFLKSLISNAAKGHQGCARILMDAIKAEPVILNWPTVIQNVIVDPPAYPHADNDSSTMDKPNPPDEEEEPQPS